MGYRVLADENIERAAVYYLRKLDYDVEWIGDVPELGIGVDDVSIAAYARENDRLILTQDVDFLTELDVDDTESTVPDGSDPLRTGGRGHHPRDVTVHRPVRRHPRIRHPELVVGGPVSATTRFRRGDPTPRLH